MHKDTKWAKQKVYFPISDNWRKQDTREADCTERTCACLLDYPETDQRYMGVIW